MCDIYVLWAVEHTRMTRAVVQEERMDVDKKKRASHN